MESLEEIPGFFFFNLSFHLNCGMNLDTIDSITESDRLNLCDICWFIQGMNFTQKKHEATFHEDHVDSLRKVISAISNRLSDDKRKKDGQTVNP